MKNLPLLFLAVVLSSCATSGGIPTRKGQPVPEYTPRKVIRLDPKKADWNSMADVKAALAGQPVKISGNKLDLNN